MSQQKLGQNLQQNRKNRSAKIMSKNLLKNHRQNSSTKTWKSCDQKSHTNLWVLAQNIGNRQNSEFLLKSGKFCFPKGNATFSWNSLFWISLTLSTFEFEFFDLHKFDFTINFRKCFISPGILNSWFRSVSQHFMKLFQSKFWWSTNLIILSNSGRIYFPKGNATFH